MDTMQPQFPDEAPMNPFDMWSGADFVIKIRNVEGYANYDASSFKAPVELFDGDDDAKEGVYNQQHKLSEWSDQNEYKSYDELKNRLAIVLGESTPRTLKEEFALDDEIPSFAKRSEPAPVVTSAPEPQITTAESTMDDDDTMAYFSKLAADG